MKKQLLTLSFLLMLLGLSGCIGVRSTMGPPPVNAIPTFSPATLKSAPLDQSFELDLRASIQIERTDLEIIFLEVVEESRCPVEAECIWAGQVVIRIGMIYAGQQAGEATLTLGDISPDQSQIWIQGYVIQLEEVRPYPSLAAQNDPIVAVLHVSAGAEPTPIPGLASGQPPIFYLRVEGEWSAGSAGTFCWPLEEDGILCSDVFVPPQPETYHKLAVSDGITLRIDQPIPKQVRLSLYPADYDGGPDGQPVAAGEDIATEGDRVTWRPLVEAGRYLLRVGAIWPELRGDAEYYFGVEVVGSDSSLPDTNDLEPPALSLLIGDEQIGGVLGSYCWTPAPSTDEPAPTGLCADAFPPEFEVFNPLPDGEAIRLRFEAPAPTSMTINLALSGLGDPLASIEIRPEGVEVEWAYDQIEPGLYYLVVWAIWEDLGDATYFFPVEIP